MTEIFDPARTGPARVGSLPPRVGFLFTGQGAAWAGMGLELYAHSPIFRAALDRVAAVLDPLMSRPLLQALRAGPDDGPEGAAEAQPALFALQLALAETWAAAGVVPAFALGHSLGELAAATVAGLLALEEAARFAVARGSALAALPADGAMLAVYADEARVVSALAPWAGRVVVAACNAPDETVVSGDRGAVSALAGQLAASGVEGRILDLPRAFHSPLIAAARPALEAAAARLRFSPARLPLYSSLTGGLAGEALRTSAGWVRQAEAPVRFAQALLAAHAAQPCALVEIGPRPVLLALAARLLPGSAARLLPSLRRGQGERATLLRAAEALRAEGLPVRWAALGSAPPRSGEAPAPADERAEARGLPRVGEPIAIIGAACELPAGISEPADLWDLLAEGREALAPITRWEDGFYHPTAPGHSLTRHAALFDDLIGFDPTFFGISPREAAGMDPHQRRMLQVAWHALEDAGQDPRALAGRRVGVFIGAGGSDYSEVAGLDRDPTGRMPSVIAGRISFSLGLRGPSLVVDTACSASLTALHLAVRSLRSGECDLAIVGGVSLIITPATFLAMSRIRALAPDGRCKTFSAAADGYGRGEGALAVVLKPQSAALADGDRLRALVLGTAVNHDGLSAGLTVPSAAAQRAVIVSALEDAGVAPFTVSYLEAHGTGTPLGDPLEVEAATEVLCAGRAADEPLVIGALKASLGHLEAAAGLAGVLKVVCALDAQQIPVSLHAEPLNRRITRLRRPFEVAVRARPWPRGGPPRRAGVSAFGLSGTNAHVLLEEAPAPTASPPCSRPAGLLLLSAHSAERLGVVAGRMASHLRQHPALALADVAAAAATARAQLSERAALLVPDSDAALAALDALARGETPAAAVRGAATAGVKIACWFAEDLAADAVEALASDFPVVQEALLRCAACAAPGAGSDAAAARARGFAALFALHALFRSWGCPVDVALGQGVGAAVAAVAAGRASLEAGLAAARQGQDDAFAVDHAALAEAGPRLKLGLVFGAGAPPAAPGLRWVSALPAETAGWPGLCRALAALFAAGVVLDGRAIFGVAPRAVPLPLYPFRAERHWGPPREGGAGAATGAGALTWPLAGRALDLPGAAIHSVLRLDRERTPAVYDHVVFDRPVVPGAFHAALVLAVAAERLGVSQAALEDVQFLRALVLEDFAELHVALEPLAEGGGYRFSVSTRGAKPGAWRSHCEGRLALTVAPAAPGDAVAAARAEGGAPVSPDEMLGALSAGRVHFGPRWRWIQQGWRGGAGRAVARITRPEAAADQLHGPLHPAQIDNAVGAMAGLLLAQEPEQAQPGMGIVPLAIGALRWYRPAEDALWCVGWQKARPDAESWRCDCTLLGEDGAVVAEAEDVVLRRAPLERFLSAGESRRAPPLYALRWLPAPAASPSPVGRWRLCGAPGAIGEALRAAAGDGLASEAPDLLFLWAPDEALDPAEEAERATAALLALLQRRPARLAVVTRGGAAISGPAPAGPGAAALWGLARAARAERPELDLRLIDLDPGAPTAAAVGQLLAALGEGGTPELAWRQGERLSPRLRALPPVAAPLRLRRDGLCLVTGGLGALGLTVAEWLVEQGAGRLLLLGRGAPSEAAARRIAAIEARGVAVRSAQVDVADGAALAAVLAAAEGPLRVVVHAAGLRDDGLLEALGPERLARVLAPKIRGAMNLHRLTLDAPLERFVLFSSVAGLLGSAGQAGYAAANAFLDGLAAWRVAQGLPATSVAWGPWAGGGMAAGLSEAALARLRRLGFEPLEPAVGLSLLARALGGEAAVLAAFVSPEAGGPLHPMLASGASHRAAAPRPRPRLAALPPGERAAALVRLVREEAAAVLGMQEADEIQAHRALSELGLDSLGAQDLGRRLSAALGFAVSPGLLFKHPSPGEAAEALDDLWVREALTAAPPSGEARVEEEL